MAEKRDMLDDIIDIQEDWGKLSNPLGDIADSLIDPSKAKIFNPDDYKPKPRTNSVYCFRIASRRDDVCNRCLDACPVGAITFDGKKMKIEDHCRKCGLCVSACPSEAFVAAQVMSKQLYDRIAKIASAYEQCYVTCTRALGRYPQDNEVVLPCVGVVTPELWFALLADYDNISVYLPMGICDRCQTTTGEEAYVNSIGQAEEWSGYELGLAFEEAELTHEQTRAYKRSQFVNQAVRTGQRALMASSPTLMGAQAVANRIRRHTKKLNEMQKALEETVGSKNSLNRRHILTQSRKAMLAALQDYPELADNFALQVPVCDPSLCSMCGECVNTCPVHACDLDRGGHFSVEPTYCLNCGACVQVCEDGALEMEPADPADLVVPDPNAEKAAEQRERIQRAKAEGRAKLDKYLSALAQMADEGESEG